MISYAVFCLKKKKRVGGGGWGGGGGGVGGGGGGVCFFFFNDTATTEIYTLSLHDALPISEVRNIRLFIDDIIKQINDTDDFTLIGRVCEDDAWASVVKSNDKIISPQAIVNEYVAKYV